MNNEIDWSVFFFGCYACHELACLSDLCAFLRRSRSALSFYDIGANVGNHSLFMATQVDNVHAFEPFKLVGDVLYRQIKSNGLVNVRWHEVALGNTESRQVYHAPGNENLGTGSLIRDNNMDPETKHDVQEVIGDAYIASHDLPQADIIKIDVEGYERRVLEGLQGTIHRDRPAIMMELKDVGQKELQNERTLRSLLYENHTIVGLTASKLSHYRFTNFSFVDSDEILILPSEHADFLGTRR